MNKKRIACKVQNAEYLWKRVTRLGNCQATVTQTGNHQSLGGCSYTDTVTCLGNCRLNFIFRGTCLGNLERVTQIGNVPDCSSLPYTVYKINSKIANFFARLRIIVTGPNQFLLDL